LKYVGDFGRLGPDKGQGGKFLILPPGYEGDVPDGYQEAQPDTAQVVALPRLRGLLHRYAWSQAA
ncbi:MAG: DUF1254 domain-containing protein, partial [Deltaproteobacteria bacterium]|jgi:hypothetical protein|nr:DUF1254 domain-containing protein [Deltaproteobacteria bacterium]